jgi:hypothetical protein
MAPVRMRMALRILMDSLGDLVRFHISLSGLTREFRNLSQRISRRESARPQLSDILAYTAFRPRECAAVCGSSMGWKWAESALDDINQLIADNGACFYVIAFI